jgi:tRNA (adenine22-N1)-methyltransferase
MQLSRRLHAVASLVTPGNRVADIGCDHAYTSIYLAEQGISPYTIAMDVNQGPIDRAKENILKYGYEKQIETRRSDGLTALEPSEVDTILIAGMGGALMIQILSEKPEVLFGIKELVLQPQSEIGRVRAMLTKTHFLITQENMVHEDGKYYTMMKAVPASNVADQSAFELGKEEHYSYGRLLLEQKRQTLYEFLNWEISLNEAILTNLLMEQTDNAKARRTEIEEKIKLINQGLNYFDKERKYL